MEKAGTASVTSGSPLKYVVHLSYEAKVGVEVWAKSFFSGILVIIESRSDSKFDEVLKA